MSWISEKCNYDNHNKWPVTCEWKYRTIDWKCPAGQKVRAKAFWGREPGDKSTCVQGVPPDYLKNLNCPGNDEDASAGVERWSV